MGACRSISSRRAPPPTSWSRPRAGAWTACCTNLRCISPGPWTCSGFLEGPAAERTRDDRLRGPVAAEPQLVQTRRNGQGAPPAKNTVRGNEVSTVATGQMPWPGPVPASHTVALWLGWTDRLRAPHAARARNTSPTYRPGSTRPALAGAPAAGLGTSASQQEATPRPDRPPPKCLPS